MAINSIDTRRFRDFISLSAKTEQSESIPSDDGMPVVEVSLETEIALGMEEMGQVFNAFRRMNRRGKGNDIEENDFLSQMLEESADEKINALITVLGKGRMSYNRLLSEARSLFHDDSDLILALRELLYRQRLSALQKKELEKAIADLEKHADQRKMNAGANVGQCAKQFSQGAANLTAKALRASYQQFIEMDLAAAYIYQDWITQFGIKHRTRLLAFTLRALVCDMKSTLPGLNSEEYGPLGSKVSDARILNTLDLMLMKELAKLTLRQPREDYEYEAINIFLLGLLDYKKLIAALTEFVKKNLRRQSVRRKTNFMQSMRGIFNQTPTVLYAVEEDRESVLTLCEDYLSELFALEKKSSAWKYFHS